MSKIVNCQKIEKFPWEECPKDFTNVATSGELSSFLIPIVIFTESKLIPYIYISIDISGKTKAIIILEGSLSICLISFLIKASKIFIH